MNIEEIALNLKKPENGIYFSKTDSKISYPEDGNEVFMQIEENSFWFKHRNNIIAESVKKNSAEKVFFDIGGGNGYVSKRLQDERVNVFLIEPGSVGAKNATKRGIKNVVCATLEDAGFVQNSIESVGLFDVIEHIEDDITFLKNINNYMKEDGLVYITVPAHQFLWSNEDNDAGHYRRYTIKKLKKLLTQCGFKSIYSTYFFSILPIPIFLFRTLPSKLGLNKNSNEVEKHQSEHKAKKGILNKLMQKIWDWELSKIKNEHKIVFGGSCFIIGKKINK